jgi:hypothetical protein
MTADCFDISEKMAVLFFSFTLAALTIDRRRMDGDPHCIAILVLQQFAPVFRNAHDFAQHGLGRDRAQADDYSRTKDFKFSS